MEELSIKTETYDLQGLKYLLPDALQKQLAKPKFIYLKKSILIKC